MVSLSAMAVLVALSRVEIGAGGADAGRLASRPRNARRWVRLMLPPFHLALDRVARCQGLVHCASRFLAGFSSVVSSLPSPTTVQSASAEQACHHDQPSIEGGPVESILKDGKGADRHANDYCPSMRPRTLTPLHTHRPNS